MKEIKFRAYNTRLAFGHVIADILVYFDLFELDSNYIVTSGTYIHKDSIVMQFTGLEDKHGKHIYEGDIILMDDGSNYIMMFKDGCFLLNEYDNGDYYQGTDLLCTLYNESEIIGNIYENPELLK